MRIAMGILEAGGHMRIGCTAGAAGDTVAGTARHPRSTEGNARGLVSELHWRIAPLPILVVLQLQKLLLVSGLQKTMCFPVVGDSRMYAASDSMVSRRRRCCNFVHRSVTWSC